MSVIRTKTKLNFLLFTVAAVIFMPGCEEDNAIVSNDQEKGKLTVEMTDAPINLDLIQEAAVTISRIEIRGFITDTSDAVIEDAAVWIEQDSIVTTTYSDSTGGYALLGLKTGSYDLYSVKEGYDTLIVNDVEVHPGVVQTLDIELMPSGN